MKKTLLIALTILGGGLASANDSFTTGSKGNSGGYSAFDFTFSNLVEDSPYHSAAESYTLNSMSVGMFGTWYHNNVTNTFTAIALFEKSGDTWYYVGSSDKQSITLSRNGTTTVNFDFGGISLDTDTTYTAVFYGNETAFDALTLGDEEAGVSRSTLTSLAGKNKGAVTETSPIAVAGLQTTSALSGFAMYGDDNAAYSTTVAPVVTFNVVPEPATATLSLLALAGLAARRRRK